VLDIVDMLRDGSTEVGVIVSSLADADRVVCSLAKTALNKASLVDFTETSAHAVRSLCNHNRIDAFSIKVPSVEVLVVVDMDGHFLRVCREYLCFDILMVHDPGSRRLRAQRDGELQCGSIHQTRLSEDGSLLGPLGLARDGPLDNALLGDEGADWGSPPTSLDALRNGRVETEVLHSQRFVVGKASSGVWLAVCLRDMAVVGRRRGTKCQVGVHDCNWRPILDSIRLVAVHHSDRRLVSNVRWSLTGPDGQVEGWRHC
jgi:hypothetical protein